MGASPSPPVPNPGFCGSLLASEALFMAPICVQACSSRNTGPAEMGLRPFPPYEIQHEHGCE